MPYIKKELRASPDFIVMLVVNNEIVEALSFLTEYIKTVPIKQQDGIVNYIFTRLLKNNHSYPILAYIDNFIRGAISNIYLSPPSYFNYERLIGLLNCMFLEFTRRVWDNDHLIMDLIIGYEGQLIVYEDTEMKENGDID